MCDSSSAAAAVVNPVAAIGTMFAGGGQIMAAMQQQDMFEAQADLKRVEAEEAKSRAKVEAERHRDRAKRVAASARAAMAASGVSVESESAHLINKDIIKRGELDALTTMDDATDASQKLRFAASLDEMRGEQAMMAGVMDGASTAISMFSAGSGWYGGTTGGKK